MTHYFSHPFCPVEDLGIPALVHAVFHSCNGDQITILSEAVYEAVAIVIMTAVEKQLKAMNKKVVVVVNLI